MSTSLLDIADALSAFAALHQPAVTGRQPQGETNDRRAYPRVRPLDLPRPVLARLKHGPMLTLVDVSPGGALVETAARLYPGADVMLEFVAPGMPRATTIASKVLRSQVASLDQGVRYRGGFAFSELLPLTGGTDDRQTPAIANADAAALADAIASLKTVATRTRDRRVARLLDDIVGQIHLSASPKDLMAFVEARLRRDVPLLAVAFGTRPSSGPGDQLWFDLGRTDADALQRMHVEFRPACRLDDGQKALLHAGASAMSLIYSWNRPLLPGR